jgi:hypothetical protein
LANWKGYRAAGNPSKKFVMGVGAMKLRCVLLGALFAGALLFGLGCATDGDKGQWDDFWKDLRGDNMKMKGFSDQGGKSKATD